MIFKVIRKNGIWHTYEYEYQKSSYHCINCGSDEVYSDVKQTEFYEGRQHVCLKCECTFFIPLEPERDQESLSFVEQIRSQLKQIEGKHTISRSQVFRCSHCDSTDIDCDSIKHKEELLEVEIHCNECKKETTTHIYLTRVEVIE